MTEKQKEPELGVGNGSAYQWHLFEERGKKQVCLERNTKDVARRLCDKINTDRNKDIIISTEPRKGDGLEPQKHCQSQPAEPAKGNRVCASSLEGGFTTTKSSAQVEDYKGISELARALPTTAQTPEMLFPHSQRAEQVPRRSIGMQQPHREPQPQKYHQESDGVITAPTAWFSESQDSKHLRFLCSLPCWAGLLEPIILSLFSLSAFQKGNACPVCILPLCFGSA